MSVNIKSHENPLYNTLFVEQDFTETDAQILKYM